MPQQQIAIQVLRERFWKNRAVKLGAQAVAYWRIFLHADLNWIDLLDALDCPAIISDDAASRLHLLLMVETNVVAPEHRRAFWETKIKDAGLRATARVSDWIGSSEELSVAWRRLSDAIQVTDSPESASGS
jgi:hypothetical protein